MRIVTICPNASQKVYKPLSQWMSCYTLCDKAMPEACCDASSQAEVLLANLERNQEALDKGQGMQQGHYTMRILFSGLANMNSRTWSRENWTWAEASFHRLPASPRNVASELTRRGGLAGCCNHFANTVNTCFLGCCWSKEGVRSQSSRLGKLG